jgi:hypothetical protein
MRSLRDSWLGDDGVDLRIHHRADEVRLLACGTMEDIIEPCVTQRGRMALFRGHRVSTCASATSAWGSQKVIAIV